MSEETIPIEVPEPRREAEATTATLDVPDAESASVPDAVKEADTSKRAAKDRLGSVRGRGIEWVRTSDLITRGTGVMAGAGIRFNKAAVLQTRRGVVAVGRAVSKRARKLSPLSAFGRRGSRADGPVRSGVGMR